MSIKHFLWVYVFLFYLMLVYRVTSIGTVWMIGFYPELIRWDEIFLVPFGNFDSIKSIAPYLLNILMTVPLGFLLPLIWKEFRSVKRVALAGFSLSLAIELSQILNRRATMVDDVIANTLGAVAGYFVFMLLFKIFRKDAEFKSASKHRSPLLRHEAVIYLICSFVGVFLFYNGFFIDRINDSIRNTDSAVYDFDGGNIIVNNTDTHEPESETGDGGEESESGNEIPDGDTGVESAALITKGVILQVNNDTLKIEKADILYETEEVSLLHSKGEEIIVYLSDQTAFEISRTNAKGTIEPVVSQATKSDALISDNVEIYGRYEGETIIAERIVLIRFDG